MVLISGTGLDLADLPNGDVVDYQIENNVSKTAEFNHQLLFL